MARKRHRSTRRSAAPRRRRPLTAFEVLERRFALSASWSGGTWTITGDGDPTQPDDTIVVERNPDNGRQLRAVVNGVVVGSRLESTVRVIRVSGSEGDDSIRIDVPGNARIRTVLSGGTGDDSIVGGEGADRIFGNAGADSLLGGAGRDSLFGGEGDDSASGGADNDAIYGQGGDDTLRAGGGRNVLDGGAGADSYFGRRGFDRARLAGGEQLIGNETTNPLSRVDDMTRLATWYVDTAMARWGDSLGQDASPWGRWPVVMYGLQGNERIAPALAAPAQSGDFSGTNNQVAGVDEGDMVKTNGSHLFVLAGDGIDIVQAWPAAETGVVSHLATPGWERAIYLDGSRLTVISQDNSWDDVSDDSSPTDARLGWWGRQWQPSVIVTVIDVSNVAAPAILETTRLEGWLVDSRSIEGRVLVVTQDSFDIPAPAIITIPPSDAPPTDEPPSFELPTPTVDGGSEVPALALIPAARPGWIGDPGDGTRYVYEDEAAYRARLERTWASTAVPRFRVTDATGAEADGAMVVPGKAYAPVSSTDESILSVVSFEVSDDVAGPDAVTSVTGVSGQVSASTSSLYVSAANFGTWWDVTDVDPTTNIYKFDLQQVDVPLVAMGAVPGLTLNQFSLDEHTDGLLRVATTGGFGDESSSGVYVLATSGGNLQTVGSVQGLAKGERIYSVRFVGDVGYVSTFREIDPLFVIDLANPQAPRVAGQLKVPGYSSYLHPLDATHLLGIGRDVDPATGQVRGLQLSVFDVGNPAKPERTATYTFPGTGWESWSEAEWDHHAVSWFAEQRILAIPVQQGFGWEQGAGLVVFRVNLDTADGFENLGQISHDGSVQRSLRIGEYLYSISSGQVQVHRIDDPTAAVATTTLTSTPPYPWYVW